MTKQHLIHRLVGPSSHYLSGLWEPQEVLSNLFWSADVATSRTIAVQIHTTVVTSDWSHEQIAALVVYYTADNPSRDQIAIYITHVMYSIICT